mmetsp:Transcript_12532/g.18943  ORF Transcript_12532/g.18943 Transcript_12532/m.18943 type:complete len:629 (+) Transcript_12532:43-1929(+)
MVPLPLLLFMMVITVSYVLALGKEKDIYHVITGEPDTPYKKSLDPVYYVGIYEEKPTMIPKTYEIEIMTADSGKRFTCLIPKSEEKVSTIPPSPGNKPTTTTTTGDVAQQSGHAAMDATQQQQQNTDDTFSTSTDDNSQNTQTPNDVDDIDDIDKSAEERLQEVDTLENRNRFLEEIISHQSPKKNTHSNLKPQPPSKPQNVCFYSRDGYWSYEVCLFAQIAQFHGSKKKRNPNLSVGSYATFIDVTKLLMKDEHYPYLYLSDIYGTQLFEERNFIHLWYDGGDGKRQSLVSVQCTNAYGARRKDGILRVTEPKIHHYHFIVLYAPICDYEAWLRREYNLAPPSSTANSGVDGGGDNVNAASTANRQLSTNLVTNRYSATAEQLLSDLNIDAHSDDVSLLLSPLLHNAQRQHCLMLKQGWWTVEFCYGQFIRQIHVEAKRSQNQQGQVVQSLTEWEVKQEHVVGRWPHDKVVDKSSFIIHKHAEDPRRTYASIVYHNGDDCDLTHEPRSTQIQFRCAPHLEHSQLVKSREDPSCHYIAQVDTPLLCQHPDFRIPTAPSLEIVCYPLNETEFVHAASMMKAAVDIQRETDPILDIVTKTAHSKYAQMMKKEKTDLETTEIQTQKSKTEL